MRKSWTLTLLVLFAIASLVYAMGGGGGGASQRTHRGFQGKITDQEGKPLKDVQITLFSVDPSAVEKAKASDSSDEEKALSTSSGKNGKYRFIAVRHGHYRVRYELDGYQTLEKLIEFRRGSKDAVLDIQMKHLQPATAAGSSSGN